MSAEEQRQWYNEEKMKKEHKEAQDALENFKRPNRPKNFTEGLGKGLGNIVGGAVGAAGAAVMMPMMGTYEGAKRGGVVGGVVGLAGGVAVGAVAAVGILGGGVVGGTTDIAKGVVAGPKSWVAIKQGKWWSESRCEWIKTDLAKEKLAYENIPEDDEDILGKLKKDIDMKSSRKLNVDNADSGVHDTYYYDILDVDPKADAHAIKRRYYILARQNHPDKVGVDNKEAANKFKEAAEAYHVLSDPELRARYDKVGKDGLSADKTSVVENVSVDTALLFAHLFGSDKFYDYIGRFSMATSASVGDSEGISPKNAMELQLRRCSRLAFKLADRINDYVVNGEASKSPEKWKEEAVELTKSSCGLKLVHTIGKVYQLTAVYFLGSTESGIGLPSVSKWANSHIANREKNATTSKASFDAFVKTMDLMSLEQAYKDKIKNAKSAEEEEQIKKEFMEAQQDMTVEILWSSAVVDITSTLWEATNMVYHDHSIPKEDRKKRAKAVKLLGQIFMDTPKPEGYDEYDNKKLYENAAEEAMLETIKRRDEAHHTASEKASE